MAAQKGDILSQAPGRTRLKRAVAWTALAICAPALTVLTAFGIAPGTTPYEEQLHTVTEAIRVPDIAPQAAPIARYVTQERVLRGDTVAALFERLGIGD